MSSDLSCRPLLLPPLSARPPPAAAQCAPSSRRVPASYESFNTLLITIETILKRDLRVFLVLFGFFIAQVSRAEFHFLMASDCF